MKISVSIPGSHFCCCRAFSGGGVQCGYVLPETPSLFLISAGVFFVGERSFRNDLWSFGAAGICFGLAAYLRTNLFLAGFVAAFTIFVFFPTLRRAALLMAAAMLFVVAPWLARNYAVFDRFSPSATNIGFETVLYQSSVSSKIAAQQKNLFRRNDVPEKYEDYPNEEIQNQLAFLKSELGLRQEDEYHKMVFDLPPEKTALAKKLLREKAFENVSGAPLYFFTQALANAPRMWTAAADLTPDGFFKVPNALSLLFSGLMLLCAVGGSVVIVFSKDENVRLLGLTAVSLIVFFTISLCFLHLEIRYTVPLKLLFIGLASKFVGSLTDFAIRLNGK